jgi:hypothetical protein
VPVVPRLRWRHVQRRVGGEVPATSRVVPDLNTCRVHDRVRIETAIIELLAFVSDTERKMEVVVRLPDAVGDALSALAEKTGRSPDDLIAEALRDYLDEAAGATPRSFGIYDDPELSGADAEDWLRDNWRRR